VEVPPQPAKRKRKGGKTRSAPLTKKERKKKKRAPAHPRRYPEAPHTAARSFIKRGRERREPESDDLPGFILDQKRKGEKKEGEVTPGRPAMRPSSSRGEKRRERGKRKELQARRRLPSSPARPQPKRGLERERFNPFLQGGKKKKHAGKVPFVMARKKRKKGRGWPRRPGALPTSYGGRRREEKEESRADPPALGTIPFSYFFH